MTFEYDQNRLKDEMIAVMKMTVNNQAEDSNPPGFLTVVELCEILKWGKQRVRQTLKAMEDEGSLEVEFVNRRNITGRYSNIPAYRMKENK